MILETERLVLREYTDADVPAVLNYYADERYWRFYNEEERVGEAGARQMVSMFRGWQAESPRTHYQLAATLKDTGSLVGSCGLRVRRLVDHGNADAIFVADIGYEDGACALGSGLRDGGSETHRPLWFRGVEAAPGLVLLPRRQRHFVTGHGEGRPALRGASAREPVAEGPLVGFAGLRPAGAGVAPAGCKA